MLIDDRNAFTVIEVVVVVTILAVLAAMFVPRFASAEEDTRIVAVSEDFMRIAKAFDYFKSTNGYWPPDTAAGQMPPEMRSAFKSGNPFLNGCPIGGVYDYDNLPGEPALIIAIRASAAHPLPSVSDALALDAHLDDGDLRTGNFRSLSDGYGYAFNRK